MVDSPRPVEPAAPMSLSVYWPAPMIGLSPTRPGILNARPEVVVTEEISPWGVGASEDGSRGRYRHVLCPWGAHMDVSWGYRLPRLHSHTARVWGEQSSSLEDA